MKLYLPRADTGRRAALPSVWVCAGAIAFGPAAAQTLGNVSGLSFGTFAATSAGTIGVRADGSRLQTGGAVALNHGAAAMAAQYTVHGKANAVYSITMPAGNTVALSDGKGHSMTVAGFVSSLNGTDVLNKNGNGQFSVGATLSVNGALPRGNYSGSYSLIVNYQ